MNDNLTRCPELPSEARKTECRTFENPIKEYKYNPKTGEVFDSNERFLGYGKLNKKKNELLISPNKE